MTTRVFIVAVEHYPDSKSTSRQLPGTIESANRFAGWMCEALNVDDNNVVFCSSGDSEFKTHGTSTQQISQAILELIKQGHNRTERLFVYLCGHGVMIPSRKYDSDVLLCSDFIEPQISGKACIEVNELKELLASSLGTGIHLYFIDACRTKAGKLDATRLGITPYSASSGKADWFQLASARAGQAAATDSLFIDSLLRGFDGQCSLVEHESEEARFWVTFHNVADSVASTFKQGGRELFISSASGNSDCHITSVHRASPVVPIVDERGKKAPPVELLTEFDEIVFLGETNGQLPGFVKEAFLSREKRPWTRLDVLSIDDLRRAFRSDKSLQQLEQERAESEQFFQNEAKHVAKALALYRYHYAGTYGSFWRNAAGKRRAHVSAGLVGDDIRISPASDYVDFAGSRHPKVDQYFELVHRVIESDDSRCIFRHPDSEVES